MNPKILIAVSSPTEKSEPFIEHIKQKIKGEKYYIYGDVLPNKAIGYGNLSYYPNFFESQIRKIKKFFGKKYDSPLVEGIKRFITEKKIQLVLSEFGHTGAKMAPICKDLNIPLIAHFHGGDINNRGNVKNFWEEYQFLFKNSSAIIGVSEDMKEDLVAIGSIKEKTYVIPCGAHDRFFNITPKFKQTDFIFIGRFVNMKSPYYTLLAFNILLKKIPDAKLIMIGDGELHNTVSNLSKYFKIENSVNFTKWIEHSKIDEYLEASCCYVQHSIISENGDAEGTPVSILEASAAGLPIISTKHKGIKQAVIHGETGYLVEEHDVDKMAEYMIQVASDMNLAKKMGDAGRIHIKNNYSMEKYINSIDELIIKILS